MYDFYCDYVKPKYSEKLSLCYMETGSFIVHIKTDDILKDIGENVETRFDTSKYQMPLSNIFMKKKKVKKSNCINER